MLICWNENTVFLLQLRVNQELLTRTIFSFKDSVVVISENSVNINVGPQKPLPVVTTFALLQHVKAAKSFQAFFTIVDVFEWRTCLFFGYMTFRNVWRCCWKFTIFSSTKCSKKTSRFMMSWVFFVWGTKPLTRNVFVAARGRRSPLSKCGTKKSSEKGAKLKNFDYSKLKKQGWLQSW